MEEPICGTCHWVTHKSRKDKEPPTEGYCRVNPPVLGNISLQIKLKSKGCQFYKPKKKAK